MPMQRKINQRAGQVFHHRETLPVIACGEYAPEQRLIQWRAGFMMPRMGLQCLRQAQPMFHDLGWEFDKIAKHCGAGLGRIVRAAHEPMQRMAEFMKQRARLIKGKQRGRGARQVVIVDDDGRGAIPQTIRDAKTAHPGAGTFAGPRIIIQQQQADMLARFIQRFKATQIRMVARNIRAFFENQAEQTLRGVKNSAQHGFQFEMRFQRGAVKGMLGLPRPFRPIAPIPGLDRAMMASRAGKFLKLRLFRGDTALGRLPARLQQSLGRIW